MKRALFETVAVLPLVSGSVVQRTGYESAVLALTVAQNATATVKVEHCDTQDGTFEAVGDSRLFVDNPVNESGGGHREERGPAAASCQPGHRLGGLQGVHQDHRYRRHGRRSGARRAIDSPCTRSPPSPRQAAVPAVKGAAAMARMFTPPRAPGPSSNKKQDAPGEQKKQDGHEKPQKSPKTGRKAQDDK